MACHVGEESLVRIKVKSDFFADFEVKISSCSIVKDLNHQIQAQSGLSNLQLNKYSPREHLASNLTLQDAGLLDNPTVFASRRSRASAFQQLTRRISQSVTQSFLSQALELDKINASQSIVSQEIFDGLRRLQLMIECQGSSPDISFCFG